MIVLLPNTVNAAVKAADSNAGRTDSQIESDFRMRLGRSKLATDGIQIRVKGGVATLTGKTAVVQHKGSATRMAKSAGAHQVANQIEISAAAREAAAAKMAANLHRAATASSRQLPLDVQSPKPLWPLRRSPLRAPVALRHRRFGAHRSSTNLRTRDSELFFLRFVLFQRRTKCTAQNAAFYSMMVWLTAPGAELQRA